MKKLSITLTIASLVIILDSLNAGQAFVAFILTGSIPGTHLSISATAMLLMYAAIGGFIASRLLSVKRNNTLSPKL